MKGSDNTTIEMGTPLKSSATRVMLPGSGELEKEVVIEFQSFLPRPRVLKQTRSSDNLASLKFAVKAEWGFPWPKEAVSWLFVWLPELHQIFSIP